MLPINPNIIPQLMNQLQGRNPQAFQFVNTAMRNGGNPNAILQQMMSNASPQQVQGLINSAKQFGVPQNILNQVQNMKSNNTNNTDNNNTNSNVLK